MIIYLIIWLVDVMKIDKRKLLQRIIGQELWKKMSLEEIRLYLLLIISVDQTSGVGKLSTESLERYLGYSLQDEQLGKVARTFQRLHLAEITYSSGKREIGFRLFSDE